MKRYVFLTIFTLVIVGIYHFIEIPLFNLDLSKITRESLFSSLRTDPEVDTDICILNIGKLDVDEVKVMIDSLIRMEPAVIGINLCHFGQAGQKIERHYTSADKVIFVNCENDGRPGALSAIIEDGNIVTHFNSDKKDYFEFQLTDFGGRGNTRELINYRGVRLTITLMN